MNTKILAKTALAASMFLSGATFAANDMYINLDSIIASPLSPATEYETIFQFPGDLDNSTGIFTEFGFNQLLATSIYDMLEATDPTIVDAATAGASVFGSFYDTNIDSELTAAGVPATGLAMDSVTTINLTTPTLGQESISTLSPMMPPASGIGDTEGYELTWLLNVEFHFDGILTATGPVYTGGTFDVYFDDLFNVTGTQDLHVLTGNLTGYDLLPANIDFFFDITYAYNDFLWIDNGSGTFIDANDGVVSGDYATMTLDTNINPPIPTADELLVVNELDANGNVIGVNAIRQATLDGTVTAAIPEPGSLALLGLGLLGFGATARKKAK